MVRRRPRYADSLRLWFARRTRNAAYRHEHAETLQKHYEDLMHEAGYIKMCAVADLMDEVEDVKEVARRLGRDVSWVQDVLRLMKDHPA